MEPSRERRHELTERQASVLRAVVASYVGLAAPIGSRTISHLLPMSLSPASIRTVLAELAEKRLVEKPHASAGRVPTELGLRLFVDELLSPAGLSASDRRDIDYQLDDAALDRIVFCASSLLSRHTRQLGFVVAPRLDRLVLRHVSLVRLSSERLLVVLVGQTGDAYRCIVEDDLELSRQELERIAALLNERVDGATLPEVRERLARDARALRREADRLLARAVVIGRRALAAAGDLASDLVIEERGALLEQPEFGDPRRLRDLFEAIETKDHLLEVLDRMLGERGVSVAFGGELAEPALRGCALVATPYGGSGHEGPLGVLGVIGPDRMDFNRIVPLVDYLSEVVTGKLRS